MKTKFFSKSIAQTDKIAKDLADSTTVVESRAMVIGLIGELGSGKTTFVQGFARALGIKTKVVSPTFVLMKKHEIRNPKSETNSKFKIKKFKTLYHIDAYRIQEPKEMLDLGWNEMVENPENIILVEWPENIKKIFPKKHFWLKFSHAGEKKRAIDISYRN